MRKILSFSIMFVLAASWSFSEEKSSFYLNEDGEKIFRADSGPESIDVSKYPKEQLLLKR